MTAPAATSDADAERLLSQLSNELMSPFCPGRTIASCPSDQARKLEDRILAEAKAGKSRAEIEQSLVDRYGSEIIGYAPQPVVLYGAAGAGVAGAVLLGWAGRRWLRGRRAGGAIPATPIDTPQAATPVSKAERDALDDALDEIDEF